MMLAYLLRRMLAAIPTLFWVLVLIFFGLHILPGDPAIALLGDQASEEQLRNFRVLNGLDKPLLVQFWNYMKGAVLLDLGHSYQIEQPVAGLILAFLPYTLDLAFASLTLGILVGIPLGVMMAMRRDSIWDVAGGAAALGGISIPDFCLSVLLLLAFSVGLGWFPTVGQIDMSSPLSRLYNVMLPAFAIGFVQSAPIMRVTRASMLDVMNAPYVQTARSKGLPAWRVTFLHTLRNALIPVATVAATGMTVALGGTIVIEIIFNRPGLGKLLIGGVASRDYNMIQGVILVYSFIVVVINLAVDLLYTVIDPRVSLGKEGR
ncbi:MAG: ABC transporter permease [Candidatus Tectomicrobia bacterium]|uniref:ABC transporter permease n=2 Tax=Tectimicrobiota bacterium TaxID=2528274 RepID=A0A932MP57_UNCTE|nr:ABC transporter permease [Candidatus Tectomicrobia bacterium]